MEKLKELQITPKDELVDLIKQGRFFEFCFLYAFNKGLGNISLNNEDVKFTVGDYRVEFDREDVLFMIRHKEYTFRIIAAGLYETNFIGESSEAIEEFLTEFTKE